MNERATNSTNKNIGDPHKEINEFKMGYQPRNKFVKDDMLADSHARMQGKILTLKVLVH
jgi:hypothetical protein